MSLQLDSATDASGESLTVITGIQQEKGNVSDYLQMAISTLFVEL